MNPPEYTIGGRVAQFCFMYPKIAANVDTLEVNLSDVRAADGLQISYDFDRDGWVVKQASKWEWAADDPNCGDGDWQEVAFVQAWAREPEAGE